MNISRRQVARIIQLTESSAFMYRSVAVHGEHGGAGDAAAAANRQVEVGAEQVPRMCAARGASVGVGCVWH